MYDTYKEAYQQAVLDAVLEKRSTYRKAIEHDTLWHISVRCDGKNLFVQTSHEGLDKGCFQTDWEAAYDGTVLDYVIAPDLRGDDSWLDPVKAIPDIAKGLKAYDDKLAAMPPIPPEDFDETI